MKINLRTKLLTTIFTVLTVASFTASAVTITNNDRGTIFPHIHHTISYTIYGGSACAGQNLATGTIDYGDSYTWPTTTPGTICVHVAGTALGTDSNAVKNVGCTLTVTATTTGVAIGGTGAPSCQVSAARVKTA